ncbi:hypothetical protein [Flavobacterium sp. GCM10023249]|uniref:hypothetical protein n=1 Tax=unclassified Flavobacterium TaxID=196869 RepID=UPI00360F1C97
MIFKQKFSNYNVLSTGVDGGHCYISTEIKYKGLTRTIVVFFENKLDEKALLANEEILVRGNLIDDGLQQSLTLKNTIIIR